MLRCSILSSWAIQHEPRGADVESTTIAVDLAKSVFEVAVANDRGQIVERKRFGRASFRRCLKTRPASRVVMEACATAHYWGRVAQEHGHRVTLLPPNYMRPYVRRNKTDQADAEALVDASRSDRIPAVPVKRAEQQALIALHRMREQWMTTRTARINAMRGLLREHGLNLPYGAQTAVLAVPTLLDSSTELPAALRRVLASVREEIRALEDRITAAIPLRPDWLPMQCVQGLAISSGGRWLSIRVPTTEHISPAPAQPNGYVHASTGPRRAYPVLGMPSANCA